VQSGDIARAGEIVIGLPSMDSNLLSPALVFGGGDFELGEYFFQEILVTRAGHRFGIPASDTDLFHVH
jgi:hypothetical protein